MWRNFRCWRRPRNSGRSSTGYPSSPGIQLLSLPNIEKIEFTLSRHEIVLLQNQFFFAICSVLSRYTHFCVERYWAQILVCGGIVKLGNIEFFTKSFIILTLRHSQQLDNLVSFTWSTTKPRMNFCAFTIMFQDQFYFIVVNKSVSPILNCDSTGPSSSHIHYSTLSALFTTFSSKTFLQDWRRSLHCEIH